jgi:hypothetical protein
VSVVRVDHQLQLSVGWAVLSGPEGGGGCEVVVVVVKGVVNYRTTGGRGCERLSVRITGIGFNESRVLQIPPLTLDDSRGEGSCKLIFGFSRSCHAFLSDGKQQASYNYPEQQRDGGAAEAKGSLRFCFLHQAAKCLRKLVALLQSPNGHGPSSVILSSAARAFWCGRLTKTS